MRQETITRNIYKFDELSKETRLKIVESWRHNAEFIWASDWLASLAGFCERFPIEAKDWQISTYYPSHVTGEYSGDHDSNVTGERLLDRVKSCGAMLDGNCPFTGYCGDENLLDPLRAYLKAPDDSTLESLLQACLDSWLAGYIADLEHWESFEGIRDDINANDYEFYGNGDMVL